MTSTVVPVFSWLLLILGISYVLQAETWIRLSKDALANAHKYYPLYLFLLTFGLVIIVEHNKWSMGWNVAITLFGWAMVIKSTVLLLAPQLMEPVIRLIDMSPIKNLIRTAGVVLATLGAILVYQNVFNGRSGL